ncbi:hypothetical protein PAXINDRAFT_21769 [Paxillus involutus ATCC 200175]|uniref:Unplaced genomic scaffold PAXINscaffold_2058, whole genome shotgun sequence n=1 Tax=Paxillus involutus ATCC 200175 TaxID=664439 RepID=A0A0C9TCE9_PAXIN|nr:hypothetical protein PAXINDRAFT_21769 [Paxillus involutus ATCC 200175]
MSSDGKCSHDHNDSLDDGPALKKVCPNWDKEPIGSTWEKYLQSAFNATKQALSPTAANPKKKFEVKKAEDGHWDLPVEDFLVASLEQQKRLVRDFMNLCWQEMVGRKGSAPFSKMTKDLRNFVDLDAGYLPDKPSLEIKDPSHMSKDNVECLLRHWKERQENQFLRPIFAFKGTSKQSRKMTERTSPNISQVTSYNVIVTPSKASRPTTMPAVSPPDDSPRSVAEVSLQSKARKLSLNAECMTKVSKPIASSFLQTEYHDGLIDNSSDESSSDSDESENTVDLWQSPNQHCATLEGQIEFLRSLSDQNEYLGLINVLNLTQVRTGSVEDTLPGRLDWKYDDFHLPPEGHMWLAKHESAFGGMLIRDAEMVAGGCTPLGGYPFIPPELKGKTIPNHYISGYILPWCKRLSEQLKESHAEGISRRPHRSPADVKGKWHEARDFMLCLSSDKQYRQLVMALEQIDNSGSPDQDRARGVLLSDFTWDNLSHHAGDVPHQSWAMALKAISLVGLSDTSGERHGRWYIALHVAFVGMVLRDVAMSKSTSATCAYPSVPSFVASTCITDSWSAAQADGAEATETSR